LEGDELEGDELEDGDDLTGEIGAEVLVSASIVLEVAFAQTAAVTPELEVSVRDEVGGGGSKDPSNLRYQLVTGSPRHSPTVTALSPVAFRCCSIFSVTTLAVEFMVSCAMTRCPEPITFPINMSIAFCAVPCSVVSSVSTSKLMMW